MLCRVLLFLALIIGGFFAFRYFSLLYAMKKTEEEIREIQQDLTQNQMLHLPVPSPALGRLLNSFNKVLEEIREERISYEQREKEFQKQIENISHDLRTPLTVILGYLRMLKKHPQAGPAKDPELADTLRILEQKAERMNTLVNQFYDYSRLCAGDFKMEMEKTDLSRVLRESLMENFRILEEAHLKVEADLPSHPLWIMGNQPALERIFLNMFQNGGRYAESVFQIAVKEEDQEIFISFTNDTKKLSPEDLPRLFDRFYIQDSARSQGGTGLGLTVARSLAEEMGGTLEVSVPELPEKEETQNLIVCFELRFKVWDFL
ncbi:MAG TPA: HAMP domain-containing histidine kinase [Candidatus Blautia avicola]|uniref:histidine kinase n=1 Tax=Candidatus Blautia avicola TaxID=2838483 RepID=A0A9D2QTW6_9FIRM|nr:HAMP domain-containing histidine kinase [Candidatus Blautia avicola]